MQHLQKTIDDLAHRGKGLLAADESTPTLSKRFSALGISSTPLSRCQYRHLLITAPDLSESISGIILFSETMDQTDEHGVSLVSLAENAGIVPGIKLDLGLMTLPNGHDELVTRGLDTLADRATTFREKGARFAKWRAVFRVSSWLPSAHAVQSNANVLAWYAATCQAHGLVPIIEPEVLMEGEHDMHRCAEVTERVLQATFDACHTFGVSLEHTLLKTHMILPGLASEQEVSAEEVAEITHRVLRRTVPAAVPSINFLSGGQSEVDATERLAAICSHSNAPWNLSFSYARALQSTCMATWAGHEQNVANAQAALLDRARANADAARGNLPH